MAQATLVVSINIPLGKAKRPYAYSSRVRGILGLLIGIRSIAL
jgi:hypothetical protein